MPENDLRIKMNFPDYIRRFERENTNVIEFGSAIPFATKIEKIRAELDRYADEEKAKIPSVTEPKTPQNATQEEN
jgi:hypothetical protein